MKQFRTGSLILSCLLLAGGLALAAAAARRAQIEADWIEQELQRHPVTTHEDAMGAVDGKKDGKWAFHTLQENGPWWHVDLGQAVALGRVVIWNRCDCPDRIGKFLLLLSDDGKQWRQAYQHDGTVFSGFTDGKPLSVPLPGQTARFVRIQLSHNGFLHLDEVEVYGAAGPPKNLALWADADQSSVSIWSKVTVKPGEVQGAPYLLEKVLERGRALAADLKAQGVDTSACEKELEEVARGAGLPGPPDADGRSRMSRPTQADLWRRARWAVRSLALRNPLLDGDDLLFVKRAPASFSHMSDQYYGWWSRPGGGVCLLKNWKSDDPQVQCLTDSFPPGSFLEPELSYDGRKILFAYCKYYPEVSGLRDKQTKGNVPEDAFYHVFEMNADGTGLRQLTRGCYDDFSARYLPSGDIVFLSTRRGQFLQTLARDAAATLTAALPDCYVRCGGDPSRPVAVYTLHTMAPDGGDLRCISSFESFEWTPTILHDGRILYARWDYVDRSNMPYMKLWTVNPDGTNPRALYGNFTTNFHCAFEGRSIPQSDKLIFTASAHHAITAGTLMLLDPRRGADGLEPLTKLTPEVPYPEVEGWPMTYYVSPWPLSERYYLTGWSNQPVISQGGGPAVNGPGLYLSDAFGNLELIYRDSAIGSMSPTPLRPRQRPPAIPSAVDWARREGAFLLQDVYAGLGNIAPGSIKALRLVGVPPKTQPNMNTPNLGATSDDPGKYVLGTVPVAEDGSAYFRAPAGASFFFQALDAQGQAVQTMRTVTCVQPGQTLSCVGCHEARHTAPLTRRPAALAAGPSRVSLGPEGSWPLRFDRLVQPVLDRSCVSCHQPGGKSAAFALTGDQAYGNLMAWGKPSLAEQVRGAYHAGRSVPGQGIAQKSALWAKLQAGHSDVQLSADDTARLLTWMDTYAQRQGAFSEDQERRLDDLRQACASLLAK